MYIFSYCPFLAPQLSLPVTISPLLLGTRSHAEHHPSPTTTEAALGPWSLAVLPLQLKAFGVLSFILFPLCLPASSDRCLLLLKVGCKSMIRVPGLCTGGDQRERLSQLLTCGAIRMSPPATQLRVANFQSSPALEAVCVGVCVWIFICVPCTRECMNWRE